MQWILGARFLWLGVLLFAGMPLAAHAQVYRCTAKDGNVAYQDRPCAQGQRQTVMDVPSRTTQGDASPQADATIAAPPTADASASPPPPYTPPPSPLPVMYECVGAVNGQQYLARSPPPPYLAPLGVMGYPPQSLSQAYGAPGGAGMSAPELSKPRIGGPRVATGMTEVQDYCLPATQARVCGYLRREYDENHRKLRMAVMPGEQKPLEQREQQLQDQLRNCR
ncbi:MAG: hypothetical protein OJF55_001617 [Rhodanobacteraceae bacterium]|jgi:hypothetical protein|nr:MAG: hypothetical protein OJF55_001617 [Rhodanobacteraceae bacterium]